MYRKSSLLALFVLLVESSVCCAQSDETPDLFQVPVVKSSWDDLTEGIETLEDWRQRREILRKRYLELIRDEHKPKKRPPLALKVHETVAVGETYTRKLMYGWMDTHLKPPEATKTHLLTQ